MCVRSNEILFTNRFLVADAASAASAAEFCKRT